MTRFCIFAEKQVPTKASHSQQWENVEFPDGIVDFGLAVTLQSVCSARGLPVDVSVEAQSEFDATKAGGHSHSWLSLEEVTACLNVTKKVPVHTHLLGYIAHTEFGVPASVLPRPFGGAEVREDDAWLLVHEAHRVFSKFDGALEHSILIQAEISMGELYPSFAEAVKELEKLGQRMRLVFWFN